MPNAERTAWLQLGYRPLPSRLQDLGPAHAPPRGRTVYTRVMNP